MKQYVGIARDHSGSMGSLRTLAAKDYNDSITAIKTAAKANDIDTIVSVVSFKVIPGDHGDWDIFVQSTSSNRILPAGTRVLYWENA